MEKLLSWLHNYQQLLATQPLTSGSYLALLAVFAVACPLLVATRRAHAAFWILFAVLVASLPVFQGEDIGHHVYRTVALARELARGEFTLFLVNPRSGEGLPTFVYYSFVPYLPSVGLNLLGLSALTAVTIVLAALLLVLFVGLQRLIDEVCDERARPAAYVAALLFVTATYVYGLWLRRMALSEIWVYSLVPWTTLYLIRPGAWRRLSFLFFLQIVAHPIVFPPAFACTLLVACGLSEDSPAALIRRCLGAVLLAIIVGSPFWLPQALWKGDILGIAGLPARFADTFLSPLQILSPKFVRTIGPFLPLAALLAVIGAGTRTSLGSWLLFLLFVVGVALQSTLLRPLALHIPTLDQSLFVWRLMFPAAFLGLGALIAAVVAAPGRWRLMSLLAIVSSLAMLVALLGPAQDYLTFNRPSDDSEWYQLSTAPDALWGRNEFLPDYANLPSTHCSAAGDAVSASWKRVHAGLQPNNTYLKIPAGPIGIVDYTADGQALAPQACGTDLLLGPLQPGVTVQAHDDRLSFLLWLRVAALLFAFLSLALVRRRRTRFS